MTRALSADHIMFNECINVFRPNESTHTLCDKNHSKSFIITSFELEQEWDLGICIVKPSHHIKLASCYSAFICEVKNPYWVTTENSHLFGIALSSIVSFITLKVCKSPRDYWLYAKEELMDNDYFSLALNNSVLVTGPGSVRSNLSNAKELGEEIRKLIDLLQSVEYKKYLIFIQSIRMIHLSLINHREDFGLGYFLVVSAIESIAQNAIKRDNVKPPNESDKRWKEKAKTDLEFKELFEKYKESRGQNMYLKEKYVKFINDYAPVDKWEKFVPHQLQTFVDFFKTIPENDILLKLFPLEQQRWETYPRNLDKLAIDKILADSYKYRSCFVHRGEQPPNRSPDQSSRFFEEQFEYGKDKKILPNYILLLGIAKCSVLEYLKSLSKASE